MGEAMDYVAARKRGILATLKSDGRPQLSNIGFAVIDGTIQISVTDDRAKTRNLRRDPRAALHVTSDDFWSYVVVDADAELSEVAREPGDPASEALRRLFRAVQGEHPDWDEYDRAMIDDRRLVLTLHPTHTYGMGY